MYHITIHNIDGQHMVSSKDLALNLKVSHTWLMDFIIYYVSKEGRMYVQFSTNKYCEAKFGHKSVESLWLSKIYVTKTIFAYIDEVLGEDDIDDPYWDLGSEYIKAFSDAKEEKENDEDYPL